MLMFRDNVLLYCQSTVAGSLAGDEVEPLRLRAAAPDNDDDDANALITHTPPTDIGLLYFEISAQHFHIRSLSNAAFDTNI